MWALNLEDLRVIDGGFVPAKTATGKQSCEISMCGGMNERHGAYAELKVVFKFGG